MSFSVVGLGNALMDALVVLEDDFEYNHGKLFIERGRLLRYQIFQYALDGKEECIIL